ncbi:hypothetical protein Hanom_Chr15g01405581 [Helianthus anomalus]
MDSEFPFYLFFINICLIYNTCIITTNKKTKKKASPPRDECRYQIEGVGGVKWEVDVACADWLSVREVTPHLEECPLHPKKLVSYRGVINTTNMWINIPKSQI